MQVDSTYGGAGGGELGESYANWKNNWKNVESAKKLFEMEIFHDVIS